MKRTGKQSFSMFFQFLIKELPRRKIVSIVLTYVGVELKVRNLMRVPCHGDLGGKARHAKQAGKY